MPGDGAAHTLQAGRDKRRAGEEQVDLRHHSGRNCGPENETVVRDEVGEEWGP